MISTEAANPDSGSDLVVGVSDHRYLIGHLLTSTTMPDVVLVTGGTGLVGSGIEYIINTEPEGSKFGKRPGETWIFTGSSEGDLRSVLTTLSTFFFYDLTTCVSQRSRADASSV